MLFGLSTAAVLFWILLVGLALLIVALLLIRGRQKREERHAVITSKVYRYPGETTITEAFGVDD